MNPKISIIVPIYNSEKYLEECIQSLLSQTIKDLEIVLVNDGSTDLSLEIAKKYRMIDKRIKVINQKNRGVSSARNKGLSIAQGTYVAFVDSDDYLEKEMYEYMYNIAETYHLDLVITDFEQQIDGKKIIAPLDIKPDITLEREDIRKEVLPQFLCHEKLNTVCNKLYKKSIIDKFNITFPIGVTLGEDRLFNISCFLNIRSLMYKNYCGYHYREVRGSATRNIHEKDYFERALEVYNEKLPFTYFEEIDPIYVKKLRIEKFINSIISYLHIYSNPELGTNAKSRYRYIKRMITHPDVTTAIDVYIDNFYQHKSLYDKLMIKFISLRLVFGIQCLAAYSRFRCR